MYKLRLYVTDRSTAMERVISGIKALLDRKCKVPYHLDIRDIFSNLASAHEDGVLATPTLIKKEPQPSSRVIGDLTDVQRVLNHLDICLES